MSEKRGCFKVGCLGCLGVTALVVLVVGGLLILGLVTGGEEGRVEPIERSYGVPVVTAPDRIEDQPSEGGVQELVSREIEIAEPGRIVLDLNQGAFEVRPGPPGEPIRLEGRFDMGRFELTETYETYGETGWTYRVSFDRRGFGIQPFIQHGPSRNVVRLIVPRDAPVVIEGRIGTGESDLELGGLWLLEVDLDLGVGEHVLRFGEPLPVPMGLLRLNGWIGELLLEDVGNASPREVWVKHSIGEVGVDLRGAWRRDADILVRCGIGECGVRVPRDVGLEVDSASVLIGDSAGSGLSSAPEPGQPTLKLSVSGNIGEVHVQ